MILQKNELAVFPSPRVLSSLKAILSHWRRTVPLWNQGPEGREISWKAGQEELVPRPWEPRALDSTEEFAGREKTNHVFLNFW